MKDRLNEMQETIMSGELWISDKCELLLPALGFLTILMITDYISGMIAAKKESLQHPEDPAYGWSSKVSIMGIYKKIGYIFIIFVAVSTDFLIMKFAEEMNWKSGVNTMFGLLVTVWLIINELLSILENAGRMGVILPTFLKKVLAELKNRIDEDEKS